MCSVELLFLILNLSKSIFGICVPSVTEIGGDFTNPSTEICSGDLIFNEEFDELNEKLWNHEHSYDGGSGHTEFEEYVNDRDISYVENGILHILPKIVGDVPLHDGHFDPIQSARMTTSGHFNFKFGKFETRARLPTGDWLWPAVWLMPQKSVYGSWPISGEIDVFESRGNKNLKESNLNIGSELMFSTLHWGRNRTDNQYRKTHYEKRNQSDTYDDVYHLYSFEWTPNEIIFGVDNEEIGRVTLPSGGFYVYGNMTGSNPWINGTKMAPFDQNFYVIANVAVGGTSGYFPDDVVNPGGKPWKNWSKQASRDFWNGLSQWTPTWNLETTSRALQIDYIRVWAL